MKPAYRLIAYLVLGLLPLGIYLHPYLERAFFTNDKLASALVYPNYFAFILVAYLGVKLNQTRIFLTAMVFAAAYVAVTSPDLTQSLGIGRIRSRQILSFAVPAALTFVFTVREARFYNWQSLMRIAFTVTPIVLMAAWFVWDATSFHKIVTFKLAPLGNYLRLPQLALIAIAAFFYHSYKTREPRIRTFILATMIAFLPFVINMHFGLVWSIPSSNVMAHSILSFAIVAAILLHAVFNLYWHRVYLDELTGIPNRRALDERLATLSGQYVIAMVDVDHFKSFNDRFGHDHGDSVLRMVAQILNMESQNRAYRYGGEEFSVLFLGKSAQDAYREMNRIRIAIAARTFYVRRRDKRSGKARSYPAAGRKVKIRVSVGIASSEQSGDPKRVIQIADEALYKAKEQGRNRVVLATPSRTSGISVVNA